MNREEFKLLLMSQLRQEDSAMRILMFDSSYVSYHNRYQLSDSCRFYNTEFGVTGIISTNYEESGKPRFDISFIDEVDMTHQAQFELNDLISFRCYYKECISFRSKYIRFWIQRYQAYAVDYQFKQSDFAPLHILLFDIEKMEFVNDKGQFDKALEWWRTKREKNEMFFLGYRPDWDMKQKLIGFLASNNVTDPNILDDVLKLLYTRPDTLNPYYSDMGNICNKIKKGATEYSRQNNYRWIEKD